jgi:hypothetical protein
MGCGGKGRRNSPQSRRFVPPDHRCLDLSSSLSLNHCKVGNVMSATITRMLVARV